MNDIECIPKNLRHDLVGFASFEADSTAETHYYVCCLVTDVYGGSIFHHGYETVQKVKSIAFEKTQTLLHCCHKIEFAVNHEQMRHLS